MNPENKIIGAVDIGTTKIVAIAGRKNKFGRFEVIGLEKIASIGVKRGVISNIDETVKAISEVVNRLQERLDIILTDVYVGMAGYSMRSHSTRCYRFIKKGAVITNHDVEQLRRDGFRVMTEPGETIVHVIPQDYSVDHEMKEKNPIGTLGERLEGNFHVVIGRVNAIGNIEKCINRANLKLAGVMLESLASAHAVSSEEEREAGVVVVDFGGGTTELAVFYEGAIRYSTVIPLGGNIITNDIREGCSLVQKHAEAIKVKFGSAIGNLESDEVVISIPGIQGWEAKEISSKNLSCIIQARMEDIIECVLFHIKESGYYEKLGAGIVITGGGALLKYIAELIKYHTLLDVRMGYPDQFFKDDTIPRNELPLYSTAVGLMIGSPLYVTPKYFEQELFPEPETDDKTFVKKDTKKEKNKNKNRMRVPVGDFAGRFVGTIKKNLVSMFEEKDTEM
ncbi:MAG: cell division protein FtsA [Marinilabiliaceae bacterium]|nr:cell division protein FtsA [Marinilabiliaceae bacterium]